MATLTLGDVELFYEATGDGPPLVFLHGLGSSAVDWKAQLDDFSATHRCMAFDLPGSGRSVDRAHPYGPFTLAAYAGFIAQLARQDPKTYLAVSRAVMGWSVEERVASLRCPVAFLASDGDSTPVAVKEALAKKIPGATVTALPHSHHAAPLERPETFNPVLEETLRRWAA